MTIMGNYINGKGVQVEARKNKYTKQCAISPLVHSFTLQNVMIQVCCVGCVTLNLKLKYRDHVATVCNWK